MTDIHFVKRLHVLFKQQEKENARLLLSLLVRFILQP